MYSDLDYNIITVQLYLAIEDLTNREAYLQEIVKQYGRTFKRFRMKRNLKRAIKQFRNSLLVCISIAAEYDSLFAKYDIN